MKNGMCEYCRHYVAHDSCTDCGANVCQNCGVFQGKRIPGKEDDRDITCKICLGFPSLMRGIPANVVHA